MTDRHSPGRRAAARAASYGRTAADVVVETYSCWRADRAMRLGAGLAYYALFAVVPVTTLAVWIASIVVSRHDVEDFLRDGLDGLLGDAADSTASQLADAIDRTATRAGLGLIGLASLVVAATLLFVALKDALEVVWGVPVRSGVRTTIGRRVSAFAIVLLVGAYLLVAVLVLSITEVLPRLLPADATAVHRVVGLVEASAWRVLAALALAVLYRVLAPVPLRWRHLLVGGAVTAVLVVVGSSLLGIYLGRVAAASISGVAGTAMLLLLWFYYEAQIVLVGAELIKVLERRWPAAGAHAGPESEEPR